MRTLIALMVIALGLAWALCIVGAIATLLGYDVIGPRTLTILACWGGAAFCAHGAVTLGKGL